MAGAKIFVSYSHRDAKALERLRIFVRPLEREGLLTAWSDTALTGGDDWQGEIAAALESATVAVLLISQDFLSSDFIAGQEVPQILARQAAGGMTLIPVYLNHSLVGETSYPFVHPKTGRKETARLTQFQGYGTPDRPLAALRGPLREEEYKKLGKRLLTLGAAPAASPALSPVSPVSTGPSAAPAGPAQSYELVVRIERRNGGLEVDYHLPGGAPFGHRPLSWGDLRQRAGPIAAALDSAAPLPGEAEGDWGEGLWQILFGPAERWQPVLRAVFGRTGEVPQPNPTWAPVRLRIATKEPLLAGLPWRWTSWQRYLLLDIGWTFSTTATAGLADPADDLQTTAPSRVLLVLPRGGEDWGPFDPGHESAVRELLDRVWPTGQETGYVDVARTRAEFVARLREGPHFLYIYARSTVAGLLLDGMGEPEPLSLHDLEQLFTAAGHTPAVLYLNTAGLGGAEAAEPHLNQVPLLLGRRRPHWTDGSSTTALQWLSRWLGGGEDPVAAFHDVHRARTVPGDDPATLLVRANYRAWRTARYQSAPARQFPSLQVDRDTQKALVRKHIEELARDRHRRVLALVPFAAPGNSLVKLQKQLRHDLEQSLAPLVDIRWLDLALPVESAWRQSDLEDGPEGPARRRTARDRSSLSSPAGPAGGGAGAPGSPLAPLGHLWRRAGAPGEARGGPARRLAPFRRQLPRNALSRRPAARLLARPRDPALRARRLHPAAPGPSAASSAPRSSG